MLTSFSRSQLATLSGLTPSHLRYLEREGIIIPISTSPLLYCFSTAIICTTIKALRSLLLPKACYQIALQLKIAIEVKGIAKSDLYCFAAWENYALSHKKLSRLDEWEDKRPLVQILSGDPDSDRSLAAIELDRDGSFIRRSSIDESLICVYICGILERLILASTDNYLLYQRMKRSIAAID